MEKYKPITAAFTVQDCQINSAHVLIYREQHGYEIKYPSFLTQFKDIKINNKFCLTRNIDNISGLLCLSIQWIGWLEQH